MPEGIQFNEMKPIEAIYVKTNGWEDWIYYQGEWFKKST